MVVETSGPVIGIAHANRKPCVAGALWKIDDDTAPRTQLLADVLRQMALTSWCTQIIRLCPTAESS